MPFWRATIESPMLAADVEARLRSLIRPKRSVGEILQAWGDDAAHEPPFEGGATANGFKFMRIIRHRNSFLPVIFAHIQAGQYGGTIVTIRMRLHLAVIAFLAVWFGTIVPMTVVLAMGGLSHPTAGELIPFGMLAFGLLMIGTGFFPEAVKAERLIRRALAAPGDSALH